MSNWLEKFQDGGSKEFVPVGPQPKAPWVNVAPKQTNVRQDNRTNREREAAQELAKKINTESISPLKQPLVYLADPLKIVGDFAQGFNPNRNIFPTTEEDRQKIAMSKYFGGKGDVKTTEEIGWKDYAPIAALNVGLGAAFAPEANLKSILNETVNPLAVEENINIPRITPEVREQLQVSRKPTIRPSSTTPEDLAGYIQDDIAVNKAYEQIIEQNSVPSNMERSFKAGQKKNIINQLDEEDFIQSLYRDYPIESNVSTELYSKVHAESIERLKRNFEELKSKFPDYKEFDKHLIFNNIKDRVSKDLGLYTKLNDPSIGISNTTEYLEDLNKPFIDKHGLKQDYSDYETKLIDAYTRGYDNVLNKRTDLETSFHTQKLIPEFEEIIKQNKLKEPEIFQRGDTDYTVRNVWRDGEKIQGGLQYSDLRPGDEFEPRSFMSGSLTLDPVNGQFGDNLLQSYIEAPKGQSVLFPNASKVKNFESEMEVILPEKLRYKVEEENDYIKAFKEGFSKLPDGPINIDGLDPSFYTKEGDKVFAKYDDGPLNDEQLKRRVLTLLEAVNPEVLKKPRYRHSIVNPYMTVGAAALAGKTANDNFKNGGWLNKYQDGGDIKKDNTRVKQPYIKQMKTYSLEEGEEANRRAHELSSRQALLETAKEEVKNNFDKVSDSFLWNLPGSISPMAAEDLIIGGVGKGLKYLKGTKSGKQTINKVSNFISEIDWGKWNKEIPANTKLMKEYKTIEQTSKVNGTWMKNPDGSAFKGTPEQFVQSHSKNFKEAFPDGYNTTYRGGSGESKRLSKEGPVFTGNKEVAQDYLNRLDRDSYLTPEQTSKYDKGLLELAQKKSNSTATVEGIGAQYDEIPSTYRKQKILDLDNRIKFGEESYKKGIANGENRDFQRKNIDKLIRFKNEMNGRDVGAYDDLLGFLESTSKGKSTAYTDDFKEAMMKMDLDNVLFKDIIDPVTLGDVRITNHKPGNFLKSLRHNNGMFDMTNPNIYKSVVGTTGVGTVLANKEEFKQGGVIKDDRGQWDHPGEITEIGSNQITMQGVLEPLVGISNTGDIQYMEPGKNYKFKGKSVTEYPLNKLNWLNKYE